VLDARDVRRYDVEQEAVDKRLGGEGEVADDAAVLAVSIGERHVAVGHRRDPMVRNGHAVGAAGAGVYEIRLHTGVEHRVFYVAKSGEGIYVLHAFEKRTRQTPQSEIVLARRRLADVLRRRARQQEAP